MFRCINCYREFEEGDTYGTITLTEVTANTADAFDTRAYDATIPMCLSCLFDR